MQALGSKIFIRLLGLIFFLAFCSLLIQIKGLYLSNGISPISINDQYCDWLLYTANILGLLLSLVLFLSPLKFTNKFINLQDGIIILVLYAIYLFFVNFGNVFMHFQWDILLLETSFWTALYCFLSQNSFNEKIFIWIFRILIFKLMLMSGLVKLSSGDPNWWNLKALEYHYYTQPIPNPLSFFVQQMPSWFHKLSCALMFAIELIVPFFIFINARFRLIAAILFSLLQLAIFATGNYCFFNLLTLILCLWLVDDKYLKKLIPTKLAELLTNKKLTNPQEVIESSINQRLSSLNLNKYHLTKFICILLLGFYGFSSTSYIISRSPGEIPGKIFFTELSNNYLKNYHQYFISNPYGLFAVMTTKRNEIIIQGLEDEKSSWKDYEFYFKPGDPRRMPPQVAPYQPRLDWQMWFAALSGYENHPWLAGFVIGLLEGKADIIRLLRYNPFPEKPPKYIRAVIYEYKFNTLNGYQKTGEVWTRELKGLYLPAVVLKE